MSKYFHFVPFLGLTVPVSLGYLTKTPQENGTQEVSEYF